MWHLEPGIQSWLSTVLLAGFGYLRLCPCVVFRAWDSALVEFDSRQIVPVLMRSRTCYGVGVYYKKYIHIYIYVYIQIDR